MPASPSPLPRSSRVRNAAVVVALVAVGLAARGRDAQGTQPPAAPPAAPTATAAADSAVQDSTKADSTAVADTLMDLSLVMAAEAAAASATTAPVAVAPSAWPVDPTTGQTLINGRPVVGRVFIMQKTDGTVKYPNVADVVAHEALAQQLAAAVQVGASAPVGGLWFREAGGMPPSQYSKSSPPFGMPPLKWSTF